MPTMNEKSPPIIAALRACVGDAHVVTAESDLAAYNNDWRGYYKGHALAVVRPSSTDEVAATVKIAAAGAIGIVPQGGNTGLCGGATPSEDRTQVVISMSRMRRVRAIDAENATMTVEAGLTLAEAQQAAENAGFIHMSVPHGAGALYSTTADLLKWEQGLFGGKLLKAASLEKMTTPFKNDYAFGLGVSTAGGRKVIQHGGGIEGFNTHLAYYPESKLTVVVLGNLNGTASHEIAGKLAALAHGDRVKLPGERKEIPLDSKVLSRYVGAYQMAEGPAMLITLEGNQIVSKLGNQPPAPIFPESETMFFLKVVDAQIEFPKDEGQGKASQLTLHQNGRDMPAKRLDEAEEKRIADAAVAAAKRFKDQTPAPGSEAALRKMIEDIRLGKPDYDTMSSGLAAAVRQQLPQNQSTIIGLGAIQSVTFKGVGTASPDIYQVKFEKGSLKYRIWLSPDGKVESSNFRPLN